MLQYRIKLFPGHTAETDQVTLDGYLGYNNMPNTFPRSEALEVGIHYGGKIELVETSRAFNEVSMTQIPSNALVYGVEKLLFDRIDFNDNSVMGETIHTGDVFSRIMEEIRMGFLEVDTKTLIQLKELAGLIKTDYIQITK